MESFGPFRKFIIAPNHEKIIFLSLARPSLVLRVLTGSQTLSVSCAGVSSGRPLRIPRHPELGPTSQSQKLNMRKLSRKPPSHWLVDKQITLALLSCKTNALALLSCLKLPSHCLFVKQIALALFGCQQIGLTLLRCEKLLWHCLVGKEIKAKHCFALLCIALLCFVSHCFALLYFALLCCA